MNLLGTAGRVFLIGLNLIFVVLGISVMGLGARIYDQGDLVDERIQPILDKLNIGNFSLGNVIEAIATIVIILGVFVFLLSLCGGIGAVFKLRPCLLIYAVVVVLLCVLEIAVVGFVLDIIDELNNTIKNALLSILSSYDGYNEDILSIAWNVFFLLLDCCGVNKQSEVDDFASTTWGSSRSPDVIPGYCCVGATYDNAANQTCTTSPTSSNSYYNTGCYDGLYNVLHSFSTAIASITFIILVIEVVAVVASCIMIWQITQDIKIKRANKKKQSSTNQQENIAMSVVVTSSNQTAPI